MNRRDLFRLIPAAAAFPTELVAASALPAWASAMPVEEWYAIKADVAVLNGGEQPYDGTEIERPER